MYSCFFVLGLASFELYTLFVNQLTNTLGKYPLGVKTVVLLADDDGFIGERGIFSSDCSFLSKTINAEESGAVAVIITDNDTDNDVLIDMMEDGTERSAHIPAFFLHGKDG